MKYPRKNLKSSQDMQEIYSIMNLLQSIFNEVDTFVKQIALDNFDEEVTMNLSSKVGMMQRGQMVSIEIYNNITNTKVVYDMVIFDLLQFCMSKTLEGLLNEKVIEMVNKSLSQKPSKDMKTVYLDNVIK